MKLRLDDIPAEGELRVEVTEGEDVLSRFLGEGDEGLVRSLSPVKGVFIVTREGTTIFLSFTLDGRLTFDCARCLESTERRLHEEGRLTLYAGPDEEDAEEEELSSAEKDYYDGVAVDLGEIMREEIALRIPSSPLCSETCRGLCPVCGRNRNQGGGCGCSEQRLDDRFAVLKNLKIKETKK